MRAVRHRGALLAVALTASLATAGCGSGDGSPSATPPPTTTPTVSADRPSSPAKLKILTPTNGQIVNGTTVELRISLKDAVVVPATTTDIVPDEGHLHVILDDQLISMTGDTTQLLANLASGQHLVKVEFVASDHAPFDPRVIVVVAFEVAP